MIMTREKGACMTENKVQARVSLSKAIARMSFADIGVDEHGRVFINDPDLSQKLQKLKQIVSREEPLNGSNCSSGANTKCMKAD